MSENNYLRTIVLGKCFECDAPTGSPDKPYCPRHRWMEVTAPMPKIDEMIKETIQELNETEAKDVRE